MDTTVEVKTKAQSTVLEVSYPGLQPPLALFADLDMIGWKVPPPAPPPAAAIDWDTPDPATGERFTIRDFPVHGIIIEPPAGSGRSGTWTDAERPVFERSLHGVLSRHGMGTDAASGNPEASTPPNRKERRRFGGRTQAGTGAPTTSPVGPALTEIDGGILIEATVDPARREDLAAKVASLALTAEFRMVEARHVESYRGSAHETVRAAYQAVAVVQPEAAPRIAEALAEIGLLDPSIVEGGPPTVTGVAPAVAATPAEAGMIPLTGHEALVTLTFAAQHSAAVDQVLGAHGLAPYRTDTLTLIETGTYRGSTYETPVQALRLAVSVPVESTAEITVALAQAARVGVDDPERVRVELPDRRSQPRDEVSEASEAPFQPLMIRAG